MSQVYDCFASYVAKSKGAISSADHLKKISELSASARRLFLADEGDPDRAMVAGARMRAFDLWAALPVILQLLTDPTRDPADVTKSAVWLESYLVRRMICGLGSVQRGLFFPDLMITAAGTLKASDAIAAKLIADRSDSFRWPDDDEFANAWRTSPLYRTLRPSRLAMILRALERSLRDPELTDPIQVPKTLHVEHIMPQRWDQWWPLPTGEKREMEAHRNKVIHTIGNLTLLKQKLNETLSNGPWNTGDSDCKRSALRQHGLLKLNAMLPDHGSSNETTILDRSNHLMVHALRIWPRPDRA